MQNYHRIEQEFKYIDSNYYKNRITIILFKKSRSLILDDTMINWVNIFIDPPVIL